MKTVLMHSLNFKAGRCLLAVICFSFLSVANADEVASSAEEINPIMVGDKLPEVALKNTKGKTVKLSGLIQAKPTVLIVYRGGWCPYCNTHLANLRKIEDELKSLGFQILAVSPDQPKFLNETVTKNKLGYTLLSDSDMAVAKALGLAFKVDEPTLKKYDEYGIDLEEASGQSHKLLPVPAAILVNAQGEVTFTFVAPNYKVRLDNDVLLAAAKAQLKSKN